MNRGKIGGQTWAPPKATGIRWGEPGEGKGYHKKDQKKLQKRIEKNSIHLRPKISFEKKMNRNKNNPS